MTIPEKLTVNSSLTDSGITLTIGNNAFPITYDKDVWQRTSESLKEQLLSNLPMASTLYLPQILGKREIHYNTARPIGESFFLRNGIYDAPYCANVDGKSSTQYLKDFFNTRYLFAKDDIKTPASVQFEQQKKEKPRALVLFSFGKESLLSFALCRELGIEPILVTIIHPGFAYEWLHKKPLVEKFEKEFGVTVHTVDYQPGLLKEGKYFGLSTELGWGLHVTEYALLALPYAEVFNCDFVVCGNEQSCNDIYFDKEDVLIYRAGLDQHHDWTKSQGLLQSLLMGRALGAYSLLEPLYEISETKILHSRYPEIGKYQMSCFASSEGSKDRRWCQECDKCAYMYALLRGFNIDPKALGFTDNLFDEKHKHLYDTFFSRTDDTHFYGSQGELGLGFFASLQYGTDDYSLKRFTKELLPKFKDNFSEIREKYLGIHPTFQYPPEYIDRLNALFSDELSLCLKN
jgi:hypothetical protein